MDYREPFDPEQLPSFEAWAGGFVSPMAGMDYLINNLSITSATFFARMLLPKFVEKEGCILVEFLTSDSNFSQWKKLAKGDRVSIESSINRLVLWDWFDPLGEVEERALEDLASRVSNAWRLYAGMQYPDRKFLSWVDDHYGPTVVIRTDE
jgi:hypothetical protein